MCLIEIKISIVYCEVYSVNNGNKLGKWKNICNGSNFESLCVCVWGVLIFFFCKFICIKWFNLLMEGGVEG